MVKQSMVVPMKYCRGDSCHQGRMPCQTPQACEVPEDDDVGSDWIGLVLAVIALTFVFGMVWVLGVGK